MSPRCSRNTTNFRQLNLCWSELRVHELEELFSASFTSMVFIRAVQVHHDTLAGDDTSPDIRIIRTVRVAVALPLQLRQARKSVSLAIMFCNNPRSAEKRAPAASTNKILYIGAILVGLTAAQHSIYTTWADMLCNMRCITRGDGVVGKIIESDATGSESEMVNDGDNRDWVRAGSGWNAKRKHETRLKSIQPNI